MSGDMRVLLGMSFHNSAFAEEVGNFKFTGS